MGAEVRTVVVRLTMDVAQAIGASQAYGKSVVSASATAEAATRRQSAAMDTLSSKAGKVGLAAAAGVALMAKAAIDWESQWAGVSKTVSGTSDELNALEGDLRGLARSMPATHQEIAATAEAAGQLGVATDDVTDFTEVMVEMGSSTNLAAEDAATSIAQFMNVMQTASGDVDEIGNTIVALGNKGASTESQITDMAQRVAGAGTTIGATEQDVLGLSAAMANLGIQSELGGGAVQRVLLGINTQVASGGELLEQYAAVAGTTADEFAQAWGDDPVRAFDMLVQGLGRIQDSGGDVASALDSMGIKGTQNLQVMLRLAGSGDMLSRSLDQSAAAWEKNDALTKEYGKRAETTASQVQVAWNRIKDAAITGGAAILPVVAEVADGVGKIADAYGALPGPIQDITTAGLAVTALLGGGLWFGAKAVRGVTDTRAALAVMRPEIARVGADLATRSGVRQFTSDLGIMAATSRTAGATTTRELERTAAASSRVKSTLATIGTRGGALLAGLTLASTDLADGMGLSNTASYALMGTIAGPWGAAIGGGIGLIRDFRAASKDASGAIDGFNDSLDDTDFTKTRASFEALQEQSSKLKADLGDSHFILSKDWKDGIADTFEGIKDAIGTGSTEINAAADESADKLTNLTGVLQGVAKANGDFIASADNGQQNLPYGDLDDLARIAAKAQPVLEELGYSLDDLMSMKPGSKEAVAAVAEINDALAHADSHEGKVEALGDAINGLGIEIDSTADQAKALGDALDALLDPGLDLSAATDEWTTALRHLNDDLAKNNRSLEGNSDAAIKNREAVRDRVGQIKDLLVAESNAGQSSEQLSRSLLTQRKALIEAGHAAGISRKEMRDYLDTIGLTPDIVRTLVQADTGQAMSAMDRVKAMLDRLDGQRAQTVVETVYQQTNKPKALPGNPDGAAGGTTVPKTGLGYADRHPYLLADGEEVTTNQHGEADRFRPELKDINAGMSRADVFDRMLARGLLTGGTTGTTGSIGRLASGGTTGGRTLDERLAIAQALQEVHDLARQLRARTKDGKHKGDLATTGIERRVLQLQLEAAREELKAAKSHKEYRQAVSEAKQGLDLVSGLPAQEVDPVQAAAQQAAQDTRNALADFAKQIREAGGHLGENFGALSDKAVALSSKYAENAATMDVLKDSIENLTSSRDDLAAEVKSGLTSDLWSPSKSSSLPPWLAGSQNADPLATLKDDIAGAERYRDLSSSLTGRGLSGDAFTDAAAKGGLEGLELLSSYTDDQLALYSSLFKTRDDLTSADGMFVGNEKYGADIAEQTKQMTAMATQNAAMVLLIKQLNSQVRAQANAPERTGAEVGKAINGTAANAGRGSTRPPKVKGGR